LVGGESAGIRFTAVVPASLAASATAWAWFPDEYATTPAASCSGDSRLIALKAPRNLNAPIRWKFSAFRKTSAPTRSFSVRDVRTGVRCATPAIRSAAACTSARVSSVMPRRYVKVAEPAPY
jgi:hypothetical protein